MQELKLQLATRSIDATFYTCGNTKAPGVIFIHDLMGVVNSVHTAAQAIANHGMHVLVPNLYSNIGLAKYCSSHLFSTAMRYNEEKDNPHMDEIHQIIDIFKKYELVIDNKLGIVGQCLTGGFILHAAIRDDIKAPVVFHHSFGTKGSGIPKDCAARIQNTIQGHFVKIDPFCPTSRVDKLEEQLGENLIRYQYNLPHGIPHLFFKNKEARIAFDRMIDFFKSTLLEEN
jgi:carboxymethylenebutenolidase